MVMVANEPPYSVCIRRSPCPQARLPRVAIPVPAPRSTGRIEPLKTSFQLKPKLLPKPSFQPKSKSLSFRAERGISVLLGTPDSVLALRELEPLSRALLAVLLAFLAARVARDHALGLQFLAQFCVELHQGARHTQLHRVGLAAHPATLS